MSKKQGKGGRKSTAYSKEKSLGEARYAVDGDVVTWDGPSFLSWHDVANDVTQWDAIAVILAARTAPFPLGQGRPILDICRKATHTAFATNGGRQLSLFVGRQDEEPMTRLERAACDVYLTFMREAHRRGTSFLGELRLHLAQNSLDRMNAPYDSYMRLAVGSLESY